MTKGGRNLTILGVVAIFVAFLTTSISLAIYHNSGDIYLDRSRPGFLPDEEEIEDEEKEEDYSFSKEGKIEIKDLEEYLEKINVDVKAINTYGDSFSPEVLSNSYLEIPEDEGI